MLRPAISSIELRHRETNEGKEADDRKREADVQSYRGEADVRSYRRENCRLTDLTKETRDGGLLSEAFLSWSTSSRAYIGEITQTFSTECSLVTSDVDQWLSLEILAPLASREDSIVTSDIRRSRSFCYGESRRTDIVSESRSFCYGESRRTDIVNELRSSSSTETDNSGRFTGKGNENDEESGGIKDPRYISKDIKFSRSINSDSAECESNVGIHGTIEANADSDPKSRQCQKQEAVDDENQTETCNNSFTAPQGKNIVRANSQDPRNRDIVCVESLDLRDRDVVCVESLDLRDRDVVCVESLDPRDRDVVCVESLDPRDRDVVCVESLDPRDRDVVCVESLDPRDRDVVCVESLDPRDRDVVCVESLDPVQSGFQVDRVCEPRETDIESLQGGVLAAVVDVGLLERNESFVASDEVHQTDSENSGHQIVQRVLEHQTELSVNVANEETEIETDSENSGHQIEQRVIVASDETDQTDSEDLGCQIEPSVLEHEIEPIVLEHQIEPNVYVASEETDETDSKNSGHRIGHGVNVVHSSNIYLGNSYDPCVQVSVNSDQKQTLAESCRPDYVDEPRRLGSTDSESSVSHQSDTEQRLCLSTDKSSILHQSDTGQCVSAAEDSKLREDWHSLCGFSIDTASAQGHLTLSTGETFQVNKSEPDLTETKELPLTRDSGNFVDTCSLSDHSTLGSRPNSGEEQALNRERKTIDIVKDSCGNKVGNSANTADNSLYTVDDSLYKADDSLYTADDSLYTADDSLYIADDSLYTADDSLYIADDSLYTADDSLYIADDSLYIADDSLYTADDSLYTADDSLYTADDILYKADDSLYIAKDSVDDKEGGIEVVDSLINVDKVENSFIEVGNSVDIVEDSVVELEDRVNEVEGSITEVEDRTQRNLVTSNKTKTLQGALIENEITGTRSEADDQINNTELGVEDDLTECQNKVIHGQDRHPQEIECEDDDILRDPNSDLSKELENNEPELVDLPELEEESVVGIESEVTDTETFQENLSEENSKTVELRKSDVRNIVDSQCLVQDQLRKSDGGNIVDPQSQCLVQLHSAGNRDNSLNSPEILSSEDPACDTEILPQDPACDTEILPQDPACKSEILPQDPVCDTEILPQDPVCDTEILPQDLVSKDSSGQVSDIRESNFQKQSVDNSTDIGLEDSGSEGGGEQNHFLPGGVDSSEVEDLIQPSLVQTESHPSPAVVEEITNSPPSGESLGEDAVTQSKEGGEYQKISRGNLGLPDVGNTTDQKSDVSELKESAEEKSGHLNLTFIVSTNSSDLQRENTSFKDSRGIVEDLIDEYLKQTAKTKISESSKVVPDLCENYIVPTEITEEKEESVSSSSASLSYVHTTGFTDPTDVVSDSAQSGTYWCDPSVQKIEEEQQALGDVELENSLNEESKPVVVDNPSTEIIKENDKFISSLSVHTTGVVSASGTYLCDQNIEEEHWAPGDVELENSLNDESKSVVVDKCPRVGTPSNIRKSGEEIRESPALPDSQRQQEGCGGANAITDFINERSIPQYVVTEKKKEEKEEEEEEEEEKEDFGVIDLQQNTKTDNILPISHLEPEEFEKGEQVSEVVFFLPDESDDLNSNKGETVHSAQDTDDQSVQSKDDGAERDSENSVNDGCNSDSGISEKELTRNREHQMINETDCEIDEFPEEPPYLRENLQSEECENKKTNSCSDTPTESVSHSGSSATDFSLKTDVPDDDQGVPLGSIRDSVAEEKRNLVSSVGKELCSVAETEEESKATVTCVEVDREVNSILDMSDLSASIGKASQSQTSNLLTESHINSQTSNLLTENCINSKEHLTKTRNFSMEQSKEKHSMYAKNVSKEDMGKDCSPNAPTYSKDNKSEKYRRMNSDSVLLYEKSRHSLGVLLEEINDLVRRTSSFECSDLDIRYKPVKDKDSRRKDFRKQSAVKSQSDKGGEQSAVKSQSDKGGANREKFVSAKDVTEDSNLLEDTNLLRIVEMYGDGKRRGLEDDNNTGRSDSVVVGIRQTDILSSGSVCGGERGKEAEEDIQVVRESWSDLPAKSECRVVGGGEIKSEGNTLCQESPDIERKPDRVESRFLPIEGLNHLGLASAVGVNSVQDKPPKYQSSDKPDVSSKKGPKKRFPLRILRRKTSLTNIALLDVNEVSPPSDDVIDRRQTTAGDVIDRRQTIAGDVRSTGDDGGLRSDRERTVLSRAVMRESRCRDPAEKNHGSNADKLSVFARRKSYQGHSSGSLSSFVKGQLSNISFDKGYVSKSGSSLERRSSSGNCLGLDSRNQKEISRPDLHQSTASSHLQQPPVKDLHQSTALSHLQQPPVKDHHPSTASSHLQQPPVKDLHQSTSSSHLQQLPVRGTDDLRSDREKAFPYRDMASSHRTTTNKSASATDKSSARDKRSLDETPRARGEFSNTRNRSGSCPPVQKISEGGFSAFNKVTKDKEVTSMKNASQRHRKMVKDGPLSLHESTIMMNEDTGQSPHKSGSQSMEDATQNSTEQMNGQVNFDEICNVKNLKDEEILPRVAELVQALRGLDEYDRGETMKILKSVGDTYWSYRAIRKKIGNVLADEGFAEITMKILKTLNGKGIFKNDSIWFPVYYCFNTLWNYSDSSLKLAKSIADNDGVRFFTINCDHEPYIKNLHSKNVYYVVKASMSILHNISRTTDIHHYFKENGTTEVMLKFATWKDLNYEMLKVMSLLTLSHIVEEEDNDKLIDETGAIEGCIKYINKALKNEKRRHLGFTPHELMDGMSKLAVNDKNKKKIIEAGALPVFLQMLKGEHSEEQAITARAIWTLSFDKDVCQQIVEFPEMIEKLESLKTSQDKEVLKNVNGALFVLKGENDVSKRPKSAKKNKGHVFISYSWNEKETVMKIRERLKKEGVEVWIDVERMGGSTLAAMAEAVENAALVLVCMSEKYKQSPNCRLEAEYTFQLRKEYIPLMVQKRYRPDGWLGFILGAKLYFDFSGKYPFEKPWNGLMKELKGMGRLSVLENSASDKTDAPIVSSSSSLYGSQPIRQNSTSSRVHQMNTEDVSNWLCSLKLDGCVPSFAQFDGKLLAQLKSMKSEAAEFYYHCLEKNLNMNLVEILTFTEGLEKL